MPQTDPQILAKRVEAHILRAARPALRRLAKASKGESPFKSEMELRACLGLARVAATLLRKRSEREPNGDDDFKQLKKLMKGGL